MPEIDLTEGKEAVEQATGFFVTLWQKFVNFLPTLLVALIVFLIGMLLARLILKIMERTMRRSKMDAASAGFGRSVVRIVLYSLLIATILSLLGVPSATIITVLGTAGVTVGLALQNTLSNLAGGFLILIAKPFRTGDYIAIGDATGYVESVSILYTKLIAIDNRAIFLPNGTVSSGKIVNLSQKGTLRVSVPVSIAYTSNIGTARTAILTALAAQEKILKDPSPAVAVTELADSGMTLTIFVWVKKADYIAAPATILECAKTALDNAGIEIPFPQVVVHTPLATSEKE